MKGGEGRKRQKSKRRVWMCSNSYLYIVSKQKVDRIKRTNRAKKTLRTEKAEKDNMFYQARRDTTPPLEGKTQKKDIYIYICQARRLRARVRQNALTPVFCRFPKGKWLCCQSMDNQIVTFGASDRFKPNRKKVFKGASAAHSRGIGGKGQRKRTVIRERGIVVPHSVQ